MVSFVVYFEDDGLPGIQRPSVDDADDGFRGTHDYFVVLDEWVRLERLGRGGSVAARTWFHGSLVFGYGGRIGFGYVTVVGDADGTREVFRATAKVKAGSNLIGQVAKTRCRIDLVLSVASGQHLRGLTTKIARFMSTGIGGRG